MTATTTEQTCRCTHARDVHLVEYPPSECTAEGCGCQRYRSIEPLTGVSDPLPPIAPERTALIDALNRGVKPAVVAPMASLRAPVSSEVLDLRQPVAAPSRPPAARTSEQPRRNVLQEGLTSSDLRIRAKAEKIKALLDELRKMLHEYEGEAAARAEVARLEAQLAAARAKLGDGTAFVGQSYPCRFCPRTFPQTRGRSRHENYAHPGLAS